MVSWAFWKKKKEEEKQHDSDLLEVKSSERISLYGGLMELVAGQLQLAIGEMMVGILWAILEGSPRYSYAHDWEGKHRLTRFKWHFQRRRIWQKHNRDGRASLKELGWRIVTT